MTEDKFTFNPDPDEYVWVDKLVKHRTTSSGIRFTGEYVKKDGVNDVCRTTTW